MRWMARADHAAIVAVLAQRIDGLQADRDRWHAEAVQWRQRSMGPMRPVSGPVGAAPTPPVRQGITPDLDAAIEEQLLLAGDPGIRSYMMAEVARRLARGDDEAAVLHAIRSGESGAVA